MTEENDKVMAAIPNKVMTAVIEEREECAFLADAMDAPEVAKAIWARTCEASGGDHDYLEDGVCGVCLKPRLQLVGDEEKAEDHRGGGRQPQCTTCGCIGKRNEEYDAYFCARCNVWMEPKCGDATCGFCKNRPERP